MRERLHIEIPIVVEGKYDKIALNQITDATILTTGGFSVFNSEEKQALLRRMAAPRGIILLTDSDGGGRQIRSFLLGILPREKVIQLYIPRVEGKERRKTHPSRSGVLGVEGMHADVLYGLLAPFAADGDTCPKVPVTKADFFRDGLTGTDGAAGRRRLLCDVLSLPPDMTPNALLEAVNLLLGREGYENALEAAGLSEHSPLVCEKTHKNS